MEKFLIFVRKLIPRRLFLALRPAYHFFLAWFAALFYGFPSRRLAVIGVTGTKGKTTVVELIHEIFREAGLKVASVSSLRFKTDDKATPNVLKMTMPGRMRLQKFLHDSKRGGVRFVIIEVTSEGIKQFRHRFIRFKTAVMTNVSPEHIESHGSFEKYLRAKLDLFWRLPADGAAVINRDDSNWRRFSASTRAHKIFYGKDGVFMPDSREYPASLAEASPLRGEFNFYNILAAASVAISQHIPLEKISSALARVAVIPGRLEFVQEKPFRVVVDYAHTPDSLKQVFETIGNFKSETLNSKQTHPAESGTKFQKPKLICVLGAAGGGRDKWKRPEFGKIAAEFCDKIILTNEDPYDENPQDIIEDIKRGIPTSYKLQATSYLDRREAIREALKSAEAGDTVVITGKGAEPWIMGPGGAKIPWDDRRVVKEEQGGVKITPTVL